MKSESNNGHEIAFILARFLPYIGICVVLTHSNVLKALEICKHIAELHSCNDVSHESRAKNTCSKETELFFQYFFFKLIEDFLITIMLKIIKFLAVKCLVLLHY